MVLTLQHRNKVLSIMSTMDGRTVTPASLEKEQPFGQPLSLKKVLVNIKDIVDSGLVLNFDHMHIVSLPLPSRRLCLLIFHFKEPLPQVDVVMRYHESALGDFEAILVLDSNSNQFINLTLYRAKGTVHGMVF